VQNIFVDLLLVAVFTNQLFGDLISVGGDSNRKENHFQNFHHLFLLIGSLNNADLPSLSKATFVAIFTMGLLFKLLAG
jgi:hypothetical protein